MAPEKKNMEKKYLMPTSIIDSDHPRIIDYANAVVQERMEQVEIAVKLYYAVRDTILYDP